MFKKINSKRLDGIVWPSEPKRGVAAVSPMQLPSHMASVFVLFSSNPEQFLKKF